jgi:tRNA-2-methylthio-N6-dimethylallyladenosine synthase
MQRLYTRDEYMRRIEWLKASPREIAITTDIIVGFCGETEEDFEQTLSLIDEVQYDAMFSFKYSARPNTPALALDSHVDEEEKGRRLTILQEKQRAIQIRRHSELVGRVQEVLVEGYNKATGQWIGRTAENRILNFTDGGGNGSVAGASSGLTGTYVRVMVTRAGPNSLAGEAVV